MEVVNLNHTVTLMILKADVRLEIRKNIGISERIRPSWDMLKDTEYPANFYFYYEKLISPNPNVLFRILFNRSFL